MEEANFMSAKKAYADFLDELLVWLPGQVGNDAGLRFMIRGAKKVSKNDYDYTVKFPAPSGGRRKAYLCFAQNDDPKSKVFDVEFSIGSKLTYGWLKAEASRMLPEGRCGTYYSKGDVFWARTEWGREGEWDRLHSPLTRTRLFKYALDALRLAKHALDHEADL